MRWVGLSTRPECRLFALKAWYGDAATPENEFGYRWVPKIEDNYSHLASFIRMAEGKVKGFYLFGQNPAAGAPNGRLSREALRKLKWMVVRDWFEIETAA